MTQGQIAEIIRLHERWLEQLEHGRPADFRKEYLVGVDFQGRDIQGWDLQEANFRKANLKGANFKGINLLGADFEKARLKGTNFTGVNLELVTGNGKELVSKQISKYWVVWWRDRIQIGCKKHSRDEWLAFSDREINALNPNALAWWKNHKEEVIEQSLKMGDKR